MAGCMAGDLWDDTESTNICIVGDPERGEREKKAENLLEVIIGEKFPNLGKETEIQVQEALRIPDKMNPKRSIKAGPIKVFKDEVNFLCFLQRCVSALEVALFDITIA